MIGLLLFVALSSAATVIGLWYLVWRGGKSG
jgi:hypothetical protein